MSAQFAAAVNRLNRAVFTRLSAGEAITVAGNTVSAVFENPYALGNVGVLGMASSQPSISLQSIDVPSDPVGSAVTVGAVAYLVAAHEPDGTGVSRLVLELAA